jgi:hypothetical protein
MKANREAVFVIESGTVTALAGGPLSLADMGARTTKRASRLEFHAGLNEWVVYDDATSVPVFMHADYDVALEWERVEYNRRLAAA